MNACSMPADASADQVGMRMHEFASELYPICRSITGGGVRETLRRIERHIPLTVSGNISRRFSLTLGSGGAPVRATTTNGGVVIARD